VRQALFGNGHPTLYSEDVPLMVGVTPLHPLWVNFAVLGGWLVVFLGLTVKFWRWE
jgi:ABC-type uncharacterized transport system permease subunit